MELGWRCGPRGGWERKERGLAINACEVVCLCVCLYVCFYFNCMRDCLFVCVCVFVHASIVSELEKNVCHDMLTDYYEMKMT